MRIIQGVTVMAAVLIGCTVAGIARAELRREDFTVRTVDGASIGLRAVYDERIALAGIPPVMLLHGARVPGIASFDLPVAGGSLAANLAQVGFSVFILDARGYGMSERPAAMDRPPEASAPLVRSPEVMRDLDAAVDAVRSRTGAAQVALFGWATGGHWAGMYATLQPERVSYLVLFNTLYGATDGHPTLGRGSSNEDPQHPGRFNTAAFGGYRFNTAASLLTVWDQSIPIGDKAAWRDTAVVKAFQQAALESDPTSTRRTPPSFRSPSGAMEDSFYLAIGHRLWDASLIRGRVLIVRSERDFWSRFEDVTRLQEDLVHAASVRSVILPGATHYAHLDPPEHGRTRLLSEVTAFLAGAQSTKR